MTATAIVNKCKELGWNISIDGINNNILTISKSFTPNDNNEYIKADGEYYSILSLLPSTRDGSMWGTDGSGVGSISALNHGLFIMHKSGGSINVIKQIKKLIES